MDGETLKSSRKFLYYQLQFEIIQSPQTKVEERPSLHCSRWRGE